MINFFLPWKLHYLKKNFFLFHKTIPLKIFLKKILSFIISKINKIQPNFNKKKKKKKNKKKKKKIKKKKKKKKKNKIKKKKKKKKKGKIKSLIIYYYLKLFELLLP